MLFPLITFPYVSRVLGTDGVGRITYATSAVAYFCLLANLGIPNYAVRACTAVRTDRQKLTRVSHELFLLSLIGGAVSTVAFVPFVIFSDDRAVLCVCAAAMILESIGSLWLYRALEKYVFITLSALACKLVSLVLLFCFVNDSGDTLKYSAILLLSVHGVNVFSFLGLYRNIGTRAQVGYDIKRHIRPALVFFVSTVAISVYTNLDTVMLGIIKTDSDVGIYAAAVKIRTVLTTVITSLTTVLMPRVYAASADRCRFYYLLSRVSRLVTALAVPMSVFFMLYAEDAVLLLSGVSFLPAATALQILAPAVTVIALSTLTGTLTLVPQKREKCVMMSVIFGGALDFVLNLVLIPRFSYVGAAVSTLASELFVLVIQLFYLKGERPRFYLLKPLAASALAAAISFPVSPDNTFLRLFVRTLIFAAVCFPYKEIR